MKLKRKKAAMKKAAALVLVSALIGGNAAYAAEVGGSAGSTTTGSTTNTTQTLKARTPFSDVKAGHWAEKHISKLSLLGIVKGDKGLFNPSQYVKQQDVIIMAIRLMGLEKELDQNTTVVFPSNFKVRNDAKPYVVLAFTKNLIDKEEEMSAANTSESTSWGDRIATREWVAKIIVRALGKQEDALELMNQQTQFKDNAQIDQNALGYINVALNLELIKGMTADTVVPTGKMNRAQIATLFSRAEKYLAVPIQNITNGVITELTPQSLKLRTDDGQIRDFALQSNTSYYTYKTETPIDFTELKPYIKVAVIESQGSAAYVEITDEQPQLEAIEGKLIKVYPSLFKMTMLVNDNYVDYFFDPAVKVIDVGGGGSSLSALVPNSQVEIKRDKFGTDPKVQIITVKQVPLNKTGEGIVKTTNAAANSIELTDKTTGAADAITVTADTQIRDIEGKLIKLSDIVVGDTVSYEIKDNALTSVVITKTGFRTEKGELRSVITDERTILFKKDGMTNEIRMLADTYSVTIEGMKTATLDDLQVGDQLTLTINDEKKIVAIAVSNRKVETYNRATVVSYDAESKLLTIKDPTGKSAAVFELKPTSKIDLDGTALTLDAAAAYFTKSKKINITFVGDKVISIQIANRYEGTLSSYNSASNSITMVTNDNQTVNLTLSSPSVEVFGKTTGSLNDLKTGDSIRAVLNTAQDRVILIQVKKTQQFEVVARDAVTRKLTIRDESGVSYDVIVGTTTPITTESNDNLAFSDLAPEQFVNVSLLGRTPTSIVRVNVSRGTVTGVDTSAGKITVREFSGVQSTLTLGGSYKVIRNGSTSNNLLGLAAGDRIEWRKDAEMGQVLTVIPALSKTFWRYDSQLNEVSLRKSTLTEATPTYKLASNVYIHQGEGLIGINSLKDGDRITLYIHKNKVIEIEKN